MKHPAASQPSLAPLQGAPLLRAGCVLLAVSGAAAITYEIVWFKLLALHIGAEPATLAVLLIGFLGGLAAGGALGAVAGGRSARPLQTAAGVEALAALLGAGSAWWFPYLISRLDTQAGPLLADLPEGPLARILGAGLVCIPAALMGMTLPLIALATLGARPTAGRGVAFLYGWNTLGGALGALICGFVLLPRLGIQHTLLAAAGLQTAVAGGALLLGARGREATVSLDQGPDKPAEAAAPAARLPAIPADLLAGYALAGVAALMAEVAWTLVFQAAFGSTAYALAAVLAVYLAGLGGGAFLPASLLGGARRPVLLLGALQAGAGAVLLLLVPAFGQLPSWVAPLSARWSASPMALFTFEAALAGAVLLPLTALLGASFPVACTAAGTASGAAAAVGTMSAVNLAGAVAGILAGRLWVEQSGLRKTLLFAALLHVAAAALVLMRHRRGIPRRLGIAALAALLVAGLPALAGWDPSALSSGAYLHGPLFAAGSALGGSPISRQSAELGHLRFYRETAAGVVSVRQGWDGMLSLAVNGRTEASSGADLASQLWMGHLPALLRPQARSALLVGLASGFTLAALAGHPLERIDCVELSPAVALAAREFDALTGAPLDDPRVRLHVADARRWLARHPGPYDLIVSQPSNFWVAGISALFTREFFELSRVRLTPGGAMAVWVQAYALDPEEFRAVVATFLDVFPAASLWEEALAGGDYFLIGPADDRPVRWDQVAKALDRPRVRRDIAPLAVHEPGDLLAHWVADRDGLALLAQGAGRVTDDNLRLEFTAPLHLSRRSVPELVRLLAPIRGRASSLDLSALAEPERRETLARLAEHERRREQDAQILDLLVAEETGIAMEPRLHLAAMLLTSGWTRAAMGELETLLEANPDAGLAWLLLGAARLSQSGAAADPQGSLQALSRACSLRPTDATAWNLLGKAQVLVGDAVSAGAAFDRALSLRADFPEALNNRGTLALAHGRETDAVADFERAVSLAPSSAALRANLGLALRRAGRVGDSRRVYEDGLALLPDSAELRFNLATLDLAENHPAQALEHYRKVAASTGVDAGTERGEGLALLALGRRQEAIEHLRRSLEMNPAQADLSRMLRALERGRAPGEAR